MPGFHTAAFQRPPFRLPRRDPNDTSRKVSVILAPAAGPGAGGQVKRGFDEMVGDLVAGAGLDVVADGYLRAPISIPANFQVKEYPLA